MKYFIRVACLCAMVLQFVFYSNAQPNINRVEYYIDTDPGYGNGTVIPTTTGTDFPNLSFTLNTSSLTNGVHIVGVRTRDANGTWSHDNKWLFAKLGAAGSEGPAPNISRVEYYLDNDPGFGNGTAITTGGTGTDFPNLFFNLDITSLSNGVHITGVRTRDANGAWSHDNKWLFAKLGSASSEGVVPAIARVEYYINTDPGYGNGTPVTTSGGTTDASGSFTLDISGFPTGVSIIGMRTKDANGAWSHDNKWLFAKVPAENGTPNISRLEYYLDTDPGYGRAIPVAINPVNNLTAIINANITGLSTGKHRIFYRSRDANGAWSHDNIDSFTVSPYNAAPAIVVNSVTKTTMCAKDSFAIGYQATGSYAVANIFNVELSNADGSFPATPVVIGSATGNAAGGVINCALPAHVAEGTAYKLRVSSSTVAASSVAGQYVLTIHDRPYAQTITGLSQVNGTYTQPYTVPTASGSNWNWLIAGGTQSSGGTTNSTTTTWAQPATPSVVGKINVIETNQYGCVGDTSSLSLTIYKLRMGNTVGSSACKGFGLNVSINADGAYYSGNTFTAELSDASGSFATPIVVGSTALVGNGVGQTASISTTIPANIANGTNYRIRLVSNTPAFTGDTSAAISIIKPDVGADITRSKCVGFGYDLRQNYTDVTLTYA